MARKGRNPELKNTEIGIVGSKLIPISSQVSPIEKSWSVCPLPNHLEHLEVLSCQCIQKMQQVKDSKNPKKSQKGFSGSLLTLTFTLFLKSLKIFLSRTVIFKNFGESVVGSKSAVCDVFRLGN